MARITNKVSSRVMAAMAAAAVAIVSLPGAHAGDVSPLENNFDQTFIGRALPSTTEREYIGSVPTPSANPPQGSLAARVDAMANASQGRIGVAAIDLASGRSLEVLGDQPFPLASTSKVAIVATFLDGVDQGRYSLSTDYPLMIAVPSHKFVGSVAPVRPGARMSALNLIELALTRSDNQAADALLAAIGGPRTVMTWLRRTGNTGIHLDHDIATLVRDDGAVNPAITIDRRDSTTPVAMVRMLSGLYRGQWLSPASQQVLLGAMSRCVTGRHRMKADLPEGAMIAHKTGTLSNTSSDVGIISTPQGRSFAVAIYVTGQANKAAREARIATIARTIYDGFSTDSLALNRPALR